MVVDGNVIDNAGTVADHGGWVVLISSAFRAGAGGGGTIFFNCVACTLWDIIDGAACEESPCQFSGDCEKNSRG